MSNRCGKPIYIKVNVFLPCTREEGHEANGLDHAHGLELTGRPIGAPARRPRKIAVKIRGRGRTRRKQ